MTAINWTISQLDRKVSDGFVITAHWRVTAIDDKYSASIYGTAGWSDGTPTIPYANLTEQEVLGWVWQTVNKQETETVLQAQIDAQKNPVTATGVPWAK